jgi:hypothetical protein
MVGRRSCCFAEASTLLLPCITSVVTIVMSESVISSDQEEGLPGMLKSLMCGSCACHVAKETAGSRGE